jgi:aspartokinase-like uncharacterized kinase
VVKVGGSLSAYPSKLKRLCRLLSQVSKQHSLVIAPGGGPPADTIRRLDEAFKLSLEASHWMAVLAVDQYGLLLANLIPEAEATASLKEALNLAVSGRPIVFLPYKLLRRENPFKPSWEAASDTIAAYLAWRLKAERLILLKNVDGIYKPPYRRYRKPLRKVSVETLKAWRGKTCLDPEFPGLLAQYGLPCLIVSGLHLERVKNILDSKPALATLIEV